MVKMKWMQEKMKRKKETFACPWLVPDFIHTIFYIFTDDDARIRKTKIPQIKVQTFHEF